MHYPYNPSEEHKETFINSVLLGYIGTGFEIPTSSLNTNQSTALKIVSVKVGRRELEDVSMGRFNHLIIFPGPKVKGVHVAIRYHLSGLAIGDKFLSFTTSQALLEHY